MKFCTHCGQELVDEASVCIKCGCAVSPKMEGESSSTMTMITKVFMLIGLCFTGMLIWPLLFTVPVTVSYFKKVKNQLPLSTGFKICCLFVSPIAGIIMFCDNGQA